MTALIRPMPPRSAWSTPIRPLDRSVLQSLQERFQVNRFIAAFIAKATECELVAVACDVLLKNRNGHLFLKPCNLRGKCLELAIICFLSAVEGGSRYSELTSNTHIVRMR